MEGGRRNRAFGEGIGRHTDRGTPHPVKSCAKILQTLVHGEVIDWHLYCLDMMRLRLPLCTFSCVCACACTVFQRRYHAKQKHVKHCPSVTALQKMSQRQSSTLKYTGSTACPFCDSFPEENNNTVKQNSGLLAALLGAGTLGLYSAYLTLPGAGCEENSCEF